MPSRSRASRLVRIELDSCSVRLGRQWVLREVHFDLRAGERWLLFGANGAGKTVLLKLLRGDFWPTPTGRESRRYTFADGHVDAQTQFASTHVAYLGPERQDRYERYESTLTVAQVVLTGFDDSDHPLAPATPAQRGRVERALDGVGLRGLRDRPLVRLSYGQRRRVLLARAIVRRPDVLLLDEALNGLDVAGRRSFLRALRRVASARMAWILSSHRRRDALEGGFTHHARLVAGRIARAGPVEPPAVPPSRAAAHPSVASTARASTVAFVSKQASRRATPAGVAAAADALWRVERAAVYRDGHLVIGAFDWSLAAGEHWCLRGPNGSGKSTLLALLYGDLWPRHGGRLQRRWPAAEDWKRRVGLVSPELQAAYAATGSTVREILASGLHDSIGLNHWPTRGERLRVEREIARWPSLATLGERHARELSYGQLRLVLAARAFMRPRQLYLFDEPYDGLDAQARARVRKRLEAAVRRNGATLVIASHHDDDVPAWVHRQLTLRHGRAPVAGSRQSGSAAS